MSRLALLNSVDHHDLRVRLGWSAATGDAVNQALTFPTEYEELQREYPLIIRREPDGRGWHAAAMLGLDAGENLFLRPDGVWDARYVPAVRQVGPFKFGPGADPQAGPMIHVDLDHPRVGRTEGAPLFLPHGGHAPYLEHMVRVLRAAHVGLEIAGPMFAAFEAHGLIEPLQMQITVDEGLTYDVEDAHRISPEGLAALSGEALRELHAAGWLRLAFMLSASLGNVPRLIDLKRAALRRAAEGRSAA